MDPNPNDKTKPAASKKTTQSMLRLQLSVESRHSLVLAAAAGLSFGLLLMRFAQVCDQPLSWSKSLIEEELVSALLFAAAVKLTDPNKRGWLLIACGGCAAIAAIYGGALSFIWGCGANNGEINNAVFIGVGAQAFYWFVNWLLLPALIIFVVQKLLSISQESWRLGTWSAITGLVVGIWLSGFTSWDRDWFLWESIAALPLEGHKYRDVQLVAMEENPRVWNSETGLSSDPDSQYIDKQKNGKFDGSLIQKSIDQVEGDGAVVVGLLFDRLPPDWEPQLSSYKNVVVGLPVSEARLPHASSLIYSCSELPTEDEQEWSLPRPYYHFNQSTHQEKHVPSFAWTLAAAGAIRASAIARPYGSDGDTSKSLASVYLQSHKKLTWYAGVNRSVNLFRCAHGDFKEGSFAGRIVIFDLMGTAGKLYYPPMPSGLKLPYPTVTEAWLQAGAVSSAASPEGGVEKLDLGQLGMPALALLGVICGIACSVLKTRTCLIAALGTIGLLFICSVVGFFVLHYAVPFVLPSVVVAASTCLAILLRLDAQTRLQVQELKATKAILAAQDDERRRIAADLHDSLKPALGDISRLARKLADGESAEIAADIKAGVKESKKRVDSIVRDLYPEELRDGLAVAFEYCLERFERRSNIAVEFDNKTGRDDFGLTASANRQILLMVQEALQNIEKHAQMATLASVRIEKQDDILVISVGDNDPAMPIVKEDGFGSRTMAHRASSIGAELNWVKTSNGKELQITVKAPDTAQ